MHVLHRTFILAGNNQFLIIDFIFAKYLDFIRASKLLFKADLAYKTTLKSRRIDSFWKKSGV